MTDIEFTSADKLQALKGRSLRVREQPTGGYLVEYCDENGAVSALATAGTERGSLLEAVRVATGFAGPLGIETVFVVDAGSTAGIDRAVQTPVPED